MTAPKRRWFRFRLRSLIVAVGVLAVLMGTLAGYRSFKIKSERADIRRQMLEGKRVDEKLARWLLGDQEFEAIHK